MTIHELLTTLLNHDDLTPQQAEVLLDLLTQEETSPIHIAAILTALKSKGETVDEIVGLIRGMRSKMLPIQAPAEAIDVCGTGGDTSGTFNISTAVSMVVAGAGVPVVKHGNRSASSLCGSADVLEALGVHIMLTPSQAEKVLEKVGLVFLFAPLFHPSFKQVGAVRKALGFPTIFNLLGPLNNPAKVTRQLIGVPNREIAQKLAQVAAQLSYDHLCLVTSDDGLDEVSVGSKTQVLEVQGKTIKEFTITPEAYGFTPVAKEALKGGDAVTNAQIITSILEGNNSAYRDIVVLNSGVALYVAGRAEKIIDGITLAQESIDKGHAKKVLKDLVKETQRYA